MIISKTPYRISFFGGGTDFPKWFNRNEGIVLSTTIDKFCYISLRHLPPFFGHKYRIIWSKNELCNTYKQIKHPVIRAVFKKYDRKNAYELHHFADLPARSGIGSSSSFTVGLLKAIHNLNRINLSKAELANKGIEIEQKILKENGISCELIDLRSISPIDYSTIYASLKKTGRILVLDTGHANVSVAGEIIARISINMFNYLKSPPQRIALPDIPTPTSFSLTKNYYPRSKDIADCILKIFKKKINTNKIFKNKNKHDIPGSWFKGPF